MTTDLHRAPVSERAPIRRRYYNEPIRVRENVGPHPRRGRGSASPESSECDRYWQPIAMSVLHYPCNWLQVNENVMDPVHTVFLHTQISYSHFADVWGELPLMEFVETPTGMIYVTTRRWKNNVWIRSNDIILPNLAQVGHIWEDGQQDLKAFARVGNHPLDDAGGQ